MDLSYHPPSPIQEKKQQSSISSNHNNNNDLRPTVFRQNLTLYDERDNEDDSIKEDESSISSSSEELPILRQELPDPISTVYTLVQIQSQKNTELLKQMAMARKTLDDMVDIKTHPAFQAPISPTNHRGIEKQMETPEQMYEELDFRLALTHGHLEKVKRLPSKGFGRKSIQDYLKVGMCDIFKILDKTYWNSKNKYLPNESNLAIAIEENMEIIAGHFRDIPYHPFIWLTNLQDEEAEDDSHQVVKGLFWVNSIDDAHPYDSGLTNPKNKSVQWNYIEENFVYNSNIHAYLKKTQRTRFCRCTDGCQSSRRCPCYRWNKKLLNPTYNKELSPRSGQMVAIQTRAFQSINKVFSFNECHPSCGCNKDLCQNYLMDAGNKRKYQFLVKRVQKENLRMWGLFAMEEIPIGAFVMEYVGEMVTKKQGDMRGTYYDQQGLSYLFDMNDVLVDEHREQTIQTAYQNQFFPLCLDSMFYGNEARFINHSCEPNVQSFNISGQFDSQVVNRIGLFSQRKIQVGEELTMDYQWDKSDLRIPADVKCLCSSAKCRGFLMRAEKTKQKNPRGHAAHPAAPMLPGFPLPMVSANGQDFINDIKPPSQFIDVDSKQQFQP